MNLAQRVVIAVGLTVIGCIGLLDNWIVWYTESQPWRVMLGVAAITAAIVVVLGARKKPQPSD